MTRRLLFLSRWFPYPPDNGSKKRIFALLTQLSREFEISLVTFYEGQPPYPKDLAVLREVCSEVNSVPYPGSKSGFWKRLGGWVSRFPRMVIERDSPEFRDQVTRLVRENRFDLVLASQIDTAQYALLAPETPIILEELEVSTIVDAQPGVTGFWQRFRKKLTVIKLRGYLEWLAPQLIGITTVSESERLRIKRLTPRLNPVWVIPNGVDLENGYPANQQAAPGTILYSGAVTFFPNYDAVRYFLDEIFPIILDRLPETRITITGKHDGVDISPWLGKKGIHFSGYLDTIQPSISQSWVSVVPLRVGGGTRLKILESLALGTPVVSTTKGAEGLDLVPGQDFLVADYPLDFADQVIRLLANPALRVELSVNGRKAVEEKYGWDRIGCDFLEKINYVLPEKPERVIPG